MRTVNKGDVFLWDRIPFNVGIIQPFENANDFYLLKDDGENSIVIGRVYMSSKYHTLSIRPEQDETDQNILQYFYDINTNPKHRPIYFGPKFNIITLQFEDGAFPQDDDYKWHPVFVKLRLVPKMWLEFFYDLEK